MGPYTQQSLYCHFCTVLRGWRKSNSKWKKYLPIYLLTGEPPARREVRTMQAVKRAAAAGWKRNGIKSSTSRVRASGMHCSPRFLKGASPRAIPAKKPWVIADDSGVDISWWGEVGMLHYISGSRQQIENVEKNDDQKVETNNWTIPANLHIHILFSMHPTNPIGIKKFEFSWTQSFAVKCKVCVKF